MPAPTHIQAADGTWWERKSVPWPQGAPTGKRDVFVNHDSRTVQWDPPPAWAEWQVLKQPVDAIRMLTHPQLLAVYKELFRVSGDKNAELYTGSAAMHSSQLDLLLVRSCQERNDRTTMYACVWLIGRCGRLGAAALWFNEQRGGALAGHTSDCVVLCRVRGSGLKV